MLVTNDNFDEAIEYIRQYNTIAFDLETTGLMPYHGDTICGVAVLAAERTFYFPLRHGEGENLQQHKADALRGLLAMPARTFVFWNAKFDLQFMREDLFPQPRNIEDVMLAADLMDENRKKRGQNYRLKDIGRQYIDPNAKDEEEELALELQRRGLIGKGDMWKLPAALVAPYAEQDVNLTMHLREFYANHLKKWELYDLWQEFNRYVQCVTDIERRGMLLDVKATEQLIGESYRESARWQDELNQTAGIPVNPNSPPQVGRLLGVSSTREEVIEKMDHPCVRPILMCRKWGRMRSAYYDSFLSTRDRRDVIHPNLNMVGTVTGRFSCSAPPLQALPRDEDVSDDEPKKFVKTVFVARPGYTLVQADYSQAEIYLGSHHAAEFGLIELIKLGTDLHAETARILGIPRNAAKRLNFASMYGIGPEALQEDLRAKIPNITLKDARAYLSQYNSRFPGMSRLYKSMEAIARRDDMIRLFTGRVKHYDKGFYPFHKASSNLIQGGVSELMRIASTNLWNNLYAEGCYQLLHVHDSIIMEIPDMHKGWMLPAIENVMTEFYPYNFHVRFKVDIKTGKRMSELVKWHKQ